MPLNFSEYEFLTQWAFNHPRATLYSLLSQPSEYPQWIRGVQISVAMLNAGNPDGTQREDLVSLRSFLPYTLTWKMKCVEADGKHRIVALIQGDLVGQGIWSIREISKACSEVSFEWKVILTRPSLNRWGWVLRPLWVWNHHWVMQCWRKSLQKELERRVFSHA